MLVAIAVAAGCLAQSTARESPGRDASAQTIRVVDHGWHTAIVVRRSAVDTTVWPEVDDFPDAAFVEVAWGDRGFYMADRGTAWLAIKAAFLTSGSVLHVAGFDAPLETNFPGNDVVELEVSRRGFDAMTFFTRNTSGTSRAGPCVWRMGYTVRAGFTPREAATTCSTRATRGWRAPFAPPASTSRPPAR